MKILLLITITLCAHSLICQTAEDYYNEAIELRAEGNFENALKYIDISLEKNPNEEVAYAEKAAILASLNRYNEAIDFSNHSISIFPNSTLLRIQKGMILSHIGEAEQAILCYEETKKYTTEDSVLFDLQNNIAVEKWKLRKFEEALQDFQDLHDIDSLNYNVIINLGLVYSDLGDTANAMAYFQKALEIDANHEGIQINIGILLQEQQKYKESLAYFDRAEELNPFSPLIFSNRSFSYLKLGELDKALKDITYSIELFSANSYAYKIRGLIYLEKNMIQKSCEEFNVARDKGYEKYYGIEVEELIVKYCKH